MRLTRAILLSTALLVATAGPASALGSYTAELSAELTLTGFFDAAGSPIPRPPALVIEGDAVLVDRLAVAEGDASAEAPWSAAVRGADPFALQLGDGLGQGAGAAGSAALPATGRSEALAATDGIVFVDNRSASETFRVGFTLDWAWSLDVARDDPGAETARADVTLLLGSLSGGTLFGFLEEAVAGPAPSVRSDAGSFSGELVLGPLDFDELGLVADASGIATAVPEPSASMLVAMALAMLGAFPARARSGRPAAILKRRPRCAAS